MDAGKPAFSLIPASAEEAVAKVLEYGAQRYGPDNWRLVPDARRRYLGAALRHVNAYRRGETLDIGLNGSTLPHLAHAICSLMFILELDLAEPGAFTKSVKPRKERAAAGRRRS